MAEARLAKARLATADPAAAAGPAKKKGRRIAPPQSDTLIQYLLGLKG